MKRTLMIAALSFLLLLSVSSVGLAAPGGVSPASAELHVHADKYTNGTTRISVSVVPNDPSTANPAEWKHLQVKGFDDAQKLKFTQNLKDLQVRNGQFLLETDELDRHDRLQVSVLVDGMKPNGTEVLSAETEVLNVTDLAVTDLAVPGEAVANQPFNVQVMIAEKGGDQGGFTSLLLYANNQLIVTRSNITVPSGGVQQITLPVTVNSTGNVTLKAQLANPGPADGDSSNNSASKTIFVKSGDIPLHYQAVYEYRDDHYNTDTIRSDQYKFENRNRMWMQQISSYCYTSQNFTPKGTAKVTVRSGNQVLREWTLDSVAYNASGQFEAYSDQGERFFLSRSGGITYFQYSRLASGQTTTYKRFAPGSDTGVDVWTPFSSASGVVLNVGDQVTVTIEIDGQGGGRLGGSFTLPANTTTTEQNQTVQHAYSVDQIHNTFTRAKYEQSGYTTW